MFGRSLAGETLAWHPLSDPPGGWGYSLGGDILAALEWSRPEGVVRAECDDVVWRVKLSSGFLVRGVLSDGRGALRLVYAGSVGRGLIQLREGGAFGLFSQVSPGEGAWVGIDDREGNGVLRMRPCIGRGIWTEVTVTPDVRYESSVGPLLLLWGGLWILRQRRRWLSWASAVTSERATQQALHALVRSVEP